MDTTKYFNKKSLRPDRKWIRPEWIDYVLQNPVRIELQPDGRFRKWAAIPEANNRYLRVVTLEDGETVHNAFFDRRFKLG